MTIVTVTNTQDNKMTHDKTVQHNTGSVPLTRETDRWTKPFHLNIRPSERVVAARNHGIVTVAAEGGWNFYKRTPKVSTYLTQNNLSSMFPLISSFTSPPSQNLLLPLQLPQSSIINSTTLNLRFRPIMKQTIKNGKWLERNMHKCSTDHMISAKTNLQLHKKIILNIPWLTRNAN